MKIQKQNNKGLLVQLFIVFLFTWGMFSQHSAIAENTVLYDDFSGAYLDPDKWFAGQYNPQEKVIQMQDGKLASFIRGKTDEQGMYLNGVFFSDPQNITSVSTKIVSFRQGCIGEKIFWAGWQEQSILKSDQVEPLPFRSDQSILQPLQPSVSFDLAVDFVYWFNLPIFVPGRTIPIWFLYNSRASIDLDF